MPITVCLKVVFQTVPELNRWAELMSLGWQSPQSQGTNGTADATPESAAPLEPGSSRPDGSCSEISPLMGTPMLDCSTSVYIIYPLIHICFLRIS